MTRRSRAHSAKKCGQVSEIIFRRKMISDTVNTDPVSGKGVIAKSRSDCGNLVVRNRPRCGLLQLNRGNYTCRSGFSPTCRPDTPRAPGGRPTKRASNRILSFALLLLYRRPQPLHPPGRGACNRRRHRNEIQHRHNRHQHDAATKSIGRQSPFL